MINNQFFYTKQFIEGQKAEGGGDAAEDVAGGLEKALSLNFSQHPDSIFCTFLFCDAPTHGKQYHDLEKYNDKELDEKINEIEKCTLEKILMILKKQKEITKFTDIMFDIMQKNFEGLIISEFSSEQLTDHIAFTLKKNQPINQQKIQIPASYLRHKLIKPKFWIKTVNDEPVEHAKNFLHQLGCNSIVGETVLEIDLNPAIHRKSMADEGVHYKAETKKDDEYDQETVETQSDANEAKNQNANQKYYPFLQNCATDHGLKGIQNFFLNQHPNCNQLCQKLNLNRKLVSNVDEEKTDGYDKIEKIQRTVVFSICDICGNQYKMDYEDSRRNYHYCKECSTSTERQDVCECCGNTFLHHHERTLRMGQVPTLCDKCDECKEAKNKCFYCETKCTLRTFHQIDMQGIKIQICQKAYEYFEQLQCFGCSQAFQKKQWPSKQEYMSNKYFCQHCQSKIKR